jgi:hypothetical protein
MNAQPDLKVLEPQPQASARCIAYDESGKICGLPAWLYFDAQRGGMVCEKHRPAMTLGEQVLGKMDLAGQANNLDGSDVGEATSAAVRAEAAAPASSVQVERGGPPLESDLARPYLTDDEKREFSLCKQIIERTLESFIEGGLAWNTVRRKRLYRESHDTFEAWSEHTYGVTGRQIYRVCAAAEMVRGWQLRAPDATPGSQFLLPAGEKTVRPLFSLPEKERLPAWLEAISRKGGRPPSHRDVQAVVQERRTRLGDLSIQGNVSAEISAKPAFQEAPKRPVDVSPIGAEKEERLGPLVDKALASVRELVDEIRTADSSEAAGATVALDLIQRLKDHLAKVQRMQAGRKI